MRFVSRLLPLLAVALLFLCAGTARAQVLPGVPGRDTRQEMREYNAVALRGVSEMLAEWRGAWTRRDPRATARFYTDDALLVLGEGKPLQGRRAIQEGLAGMLGTTGTIEVGVNDFVASGSLAYAYGEFWYQTEAGDVSCPVSGSYVMVFRRDGRSWRIRSQMFDSQPSCPSEAAPAETGGAGEP